MSEFISKITIYDQLIQGLELEKSSRRRSKDRYNWLKQARDNQKIPQGNWLFCRILAGRGFGKTRTGAEA
ncbi:MAG: ATP-binding protein, partial [Alphaproteobacteria bacterium]|nr:ATP-binding protein [Alphaproteobacteria bacterium]